VTAIEKITNLASGGRFDASDRMDYSKVDALGQGTKYDICASTASSRQVTGAQGIGDVLKGGLCHSFTPDGRCVSLFKTLYTNNCSHQCNYCPNGAGCQKKGAKYSYEPEELAKITLTLYKGNYIEGLFLSSGIGGDENETMEKMIETVELLRKKYMFNGYVHLKILPGASDDHIKHAMGLADRVSINLEAVSESYMKELSPTKDYKNDILQKQRTIRDLSRKNHLPAGQTTQMVVGAVGESDKEIFQRCIYEYNEIELKRVYYSVFTPIEGTQFEDREKQPIWREHRLYQMDWLFRVYNLPKKEIEIAFNDAGFLPDMDPKMAIARQTLDSPVDPNTAEYDELLRVPGIGPVSAERIMLTRGTKKITKSRELAALGVRINRAKAFLELNGWRDATLMRWLT
jgi:putative DNA modification/repair radical SAM protein